MLGEAASVPTTGSQVTVVGTSVFRPLVATVLRNNKVLTPAEIVESGVPAMHGETPLEGALTIARTLMLQEGGDKTGQHLFVGSNVGLGGRSIEQLSKGADPHLYGKLLDATKKVRKASTALGKSHGLVGLFFLQGESNYRPPPWCPGATTDKDEYKAKVKALVEDFVADASDGVSGQHKPPVVVTYQTSGGWAAEGLAIGQAQFEMSLENPGWYLAAPAYPVPNRINDFHLTANGSRWLGMQLGKVWHEVVVRRHGWRPTSPLQATWRADTVLIQFHVPCPPLQFQPYWNANKPVMLRSKGFAVHDAGGLATIIGVRIVADAVVAITTARNLQGNVRISYGEYLGAAGAGNLCDSDHTIAPEPFSYDPEAGDEEAFNIPELVGKPYPLWNWCIAFHLEATEDEIFAEEISPEQLFLQKHSPRLNPKIAYVDTLPRRVWMARPAAWKLWLALALVLAAAGSALDGVSTANGKLVGQEVVPAYMSGTGMAWHKRCDYRILLSYRSVFIEPTSSDPDSLMTRPCPAVLNP